MSFLNFELCFCVYSCAVLHFRNLINGLPIDYFCTNCIQLVQICKRERFNLNLKHANYITVHYVFIAILCITSLYTFANSLYSFVIG